MTEKMVDVLADAMALAFNDRYVQPIMGYVNDYYIGFSIDLNNTWVPCDDTDEFIRNIEEVREFCEFFNGKNIKEDEVDEAIADRERLVVRVALMIKNKEYGKAFETLNF